MRTPCPRKAVGMASMKDPLSSRWVQMVEQKFFCTILVAFGVGRSALSADRGQWLPGGPFCTTSSEPEAEGDRATTSLLRVLRAGADVALRSSIYSGSVPTGTVPINEIRKTPPFTRTTVPGKHQAVMPCFGVVFQSRHVHLDRLNGSRFTHALLPSSTQRIRRTSGSKRGPPLLQAHRRGDTAARSSARPSSRPAVGGRWPRSPSCGQCARSSVQR